MTPVRKVIFFAFLILAAAIVGILHINNSRLDTNVTAKTTKIGVLLRGTRTDRSYGQAHYDALESLRNPLNLDIVYRERVPALRMEAY